MRVVGPPRDRIGTSRGRKNLMHGTTEEVEVEG